LSLDESPYACWSVFDMQSAPLFTSVAPGAHRLEAAIARGDGTLTRETWSGTRKFNVVRSDVGTEEQNASSSPNVITHTTVRETSVPLVKIQWPAELRTTTKPVVEYAVESSEPDAFRELFNHSYACFQLSPAPAWPCWSVFRSGGAPSFSGVKTSLRTLRGALAHPDTLLPIPETLTPERLFFVDSEDDDDDDVNGGAWERHDDHAREFFHDAATGHSRWDPPPGYPAPARCVPFGSVELVVDGTTRLLRIPKGTNASVVSKRLCAAFDDPTCQSQLLASIVRSFPEDDLCPTQPPPRDPPPPPPLDDDDDGRYVRPRSPPPTTTEEENATAAVAVTTRGYELEPLVIPTGKKTVGGGKVASSLADLKHALEAGLITQREFDETKARVLRAVASS